MRSCSQQESKSLSQVPCDVLRGVGPRVTARLEKLNIFSVQDLLFHLPLRYQDRTKIVLLGRLRPGMQVAVQGKVALSEFSYHGKTRFVCRISDGTGFLTLRFFHISKFQGDMLARGRHLLCFGEVRFGPAGYEMVHPEFQNIDEGEAVEVEKKLTPIYPTTEGLHQLTFRKIIGEAFKLIDDDNKLTEVLPSDILSELLAEQNQTVAPSLKEALLFLHNPPADVSTTLLAEGKHPVQKRLVMEELLAHYLSLRQLRQQAHQQKAAALISSGKLTKNFIQALPFTLTKAQQRVSHEIFQDMSQPHPMLRLVQGDVGSGKTVVAALAALVAVENNYQAVIMAPTEILAEQHLKNFSEWLKASKIQIAWLSGQIKGKVREATLEQIKSGEAQIIIGTHALFQEGVEFNHLSLVIIDEQHRFGVHQRLALREKGFHEGCYPHQLIMTATPIPRTLAMCAYADLDHSVIDELPPGRKPIKTIVLPSNRRADIVGRIHESCRAKRQAYWVCTLIEESEFLQCQAAEKTVEALIEALPDVKIGLVHGRMKSLEKEAIMQAFKNGEIDLLVATTVIEVGVDVPNASLMIIENPERLGLSQLHQLRGRVGRGSAESHCVLLYQNPLSDFSKQRLTIMRESNDGFVIAQKDLELRGPGEVLGTKQTGIVQMKIADIIRDQSLLPQVKVMGEKLLVDYPHFVPLLIQRWVPSNKDWSQV